MKREKELLAAVFLGLAALWAVAAAAGAEDASASGARPTCTSRWAHPHFVVGPAPLGRVAVPAHHPVVSARRPARRPDLHRSGSPDDTLFPGDVDTDTDEGVSTIVAYRYLPSPRAQAADLPPEVDSFPPAPLLWSGSPRGPPVS